LSTVVTFTVLHPSGAKTIQTYGTDAAVVRESVGVYHVDVTLDGAGRWIARCDVSAGAVDFAEVAWTVDHSLLGG
jgi:hypothetical protein